ncbi:cyanate permease [Secundilactobacillus paracollinoides]|uniref:Cyanate permease n=3 Tax=Secundilactobacillus paracollinoides TaxID=240427 RepID=A0A1B2J113_9LACO|nr:cyanate permease [Secundilactobacillus paracollinoides]ANZ67982.1 cyanate permease [Secundilactobacillus paracollinoides]
MIVKRFKREYVWLLAAILLSGFIMRAPITTPPLMLNQLAQAVHVPQGQLGILTTIPLVMFMLFSNFASHLMRLIGLKRALLVTMTIISFGSILRLIPAFWAMIVGTIFIGIGIAHLNVFMPSLVAAYFPEHIGLYTTMYSFSMILGNTVFNLVTAPVAEKFGWQSILGILLVLAVLGTVSWAVTVRNGTTPQVETVSTSQTTDVSSSRSMWTQARAWPFLIAFGCQALLSYTFTAWMPSLMAYHHVDATETGVIMALYAVIGLPLSMILPNLLAKYSKRQLTWITLVMGLFGLLASLMLFVQQTSSVWFWLTEGLLVGVTIGYFFMVPMTMFALKTRNPYETAKLSGMAQAGGYCISAFGPTLYGLVFAANPVGQLQNVCYVVLILVMVVTCTLIVRSDLF